MKSPRPDSPIPALPTIRTIRVESARPREDPVPSALRHHSASVQRLGGGGVGAVFNSGSSPVYSTSSSLGQRDPSPLPFPQRISLKPIVHQKPLGSPAFRPAPLPPYSKNVSLTKSPGKQPEEVGTPAASSPSPIPPSPSPSSPSTLDEEESSSSSRDMEIDTISAKVEDSGNTSGNPSPDHVHTSTDLFVRPEVPGRVAAVAASSENARMQGWRCEKNFERDTSDNKMKIWPQVLVSVVVALAHLALGTVLAYPAISLPLLVATPPPVSSTLMTTNDDDHLQDLQASPENDSYYDYLPVTEVFQFQGSSDASEDEAKDGGSRDPSTFQFLGDNATFEDVGNHSDAVPTATSPSGGLFPIISILPSQAAWLASIHTVGAVFGSMICGSLLAVIGQRRTILLMAPIILTSWLTIWAAPSFTFLIAARMTAGVCIGVLGTGAQVYIVEISHESIRGSLTIITDLYVGIGLLLTYGLGALGLGWRWAAFIIGFTTITPLTVGLFFFPDSPRWLAMKGRKEDARKALQFLRGQTCDVTNEFENIQKICSNRVQDTTMDQLAKLKNPAVYTPFLTSCGVFTFSQFAGPYVVYSYTVYIFEVANAGYSPYISTVIVGVARVIGSFIGILVVEKAGRRLPLMIGGIGLALSLVSFGVYFYLQTNDPVVASSLGWLPLASMITYTVTLGATISPIPFLLSTELQPLSFRSMGSSAAKGVFFISGMLVTYSFPTLKSSLGPAVTFWLYSISALTLVCLVGLVVPETKGRTLEEIEEYYKRNVDK